MSKYTPGAIRAEKKIAERYGIWENRFNHSRPIPTPKERSDIITTIIDQETAAERDRLKESNAELRETLEDIIAECPDPKSGYGIIVVGMARTALAEPESGEINPKGNPK